MEAGGIGHLQLNARMYLIPGPVEYMKRPFQFLIIEDVETDP